MSDELLVHFQSAMPGLVTDVEDRESGLVLVHLGSLLEPDPTPQQWNAVYHVARRFGFHPGKTRWNREGLDENGRHRGAFVLERWLERTN